MPYYPLEEQCAVIAYMKYRLETPPPGQSRWDVIASKYNKTWGPLGRPRQAASLKTLLWVQLTSATTSPAHKDQLLVHKYNNIIANLHTTIV